MGSYASYLQRKQQQYGPQFDSAELAPQFTPFFENGQRIRVRFASGYELTGTVGVTTGWRPCFLLIRTSRSLGSPYLLHADDTVVAVQQSRKYLPVKEDPPCGHA